MNRKAPSATTGRARNRLLVYRCALDINTSQTRYPARTNTSAPYSPETDVPSDPMQSESCAGECVRDSPLFEGLQPDARKEIAARATRRSFAKQQQIFREDDVVRHVYIICSGAVKITQLTETGSEVILRVDRAQSPIDDMCGSSQPTHTTNAVAISDCCLHTWYSHEFIKLVQRFPLIHRNATRIMQLRLLNLEKSFCDLSTARVPQRLARVLLQFGVGDGCHGDVVGFSRQELGQIAGTSPFMISRLLSAWAERGIVSVSRSQVMIGDVASLVRLSEGRSN